MRRFFVFIISIIAVTLACENYCNGHGTCGGDDRCMCYPGWGGSDCNQRACPYREAFVDVMLGDLSHDGQVSSEFVLTEWTPIQGYEESQEKTVTTTQRVHRYAECSNAGICDRKLGECQCFDGFEGSACQRRYCPTAVSGAICSGHGECLSSQQHVYDLGSTIKYTGWELEKFYKCKCDSGWEGIDCNMRSCPKGLDPVSTSPLPMFYQFYIETRNFGTEKGQTNDNKLTCGNDNDNCVIKNSEPGTAADLKTVNRVSYVESYRLKYTDSNNINYYSPTIKGRPGECPKHVTSLDGDLSKLQALEGMESSVSSEYQEEIKRAIKKIPPLFQTNVTVECVQLKKDNGKSIIDTSKNPASTITPSGSKPSNYPNDLYVITTGGASDVNPATSAYAISVKIQLEYGDLSDYGISTLEIEEVLVQSNEDTSAPATGTPLKTTNKKIVQKAYNSPAASITSICSSRGICNYDAGECECFTGYYGMSCEKQRAISGVSTTTTTST